MSNKKDDLEAYLAAKLIVYMGAGAVALFISTCTGSCAVSSVATGEYQNVGSFVWFVVFGFIAILAWRGFVSTKDEVEAQFPEFKVKKDEEVDDVEKS